MSPVVRSDLPGSSKVSLQLRLQRCADIRCLLSDFLVDHVLEGSHIKSQVLLSRKLEHAVTTPCVRTRVHQRGGLDFAAGNLFMIREKQ